MKVATFRGFYRVLKNAFFASFVFVFTVFGASWAVTVTYNCGIASGGTTVNVNGDGSYVVSSSVDANDYCTLPPGADYEFVGWACGNTNSSFVTASVEGQNISVPSQYVYTSNNQHWVNSGADVIFANFMSNYAFDGYKVWDDTTCVAVWRDTDICNPGTTVNYILNAPADSNNVIDLNIHSSGTSSPLDYYDGNNNLVYSVWFEGLLSNTPGVMNLPGDPDTNSPNGTHCWCRVTAYSMAGGTQQPLNNAQWVYGGSGLQSCSNHCGATINEDFVFRVAAYATQTCEYNVTYHSGNCSTNGTNNAVADTEHPTAGSSYSVLRGMDVSGVFSNIGSEYGVCLDFVGWSNSPVNGFMQSASGVADYVCQAFGCGTIYPYPASNTDLYAVCTSKRYTVVYHPGSCSGSDYTDLNGHAPYGIGYTVLSNTAANITGDFQGWSTNSSGTTVQYHAGDSYVAGCLPAGSTVHFYGVCVQSYKLTYEEGINGDVQNFPEEAAQITTGQSYHLAGEPSLDDYDFIGWLCNYNLETGEEITTGYFAGDSFTFNGSNDVECVGQWQPRMSCSPGDVITYLLGRNGWEYMSEMISSENIGELVDDPDKPSVKFNEDTINYSYMCSEDPGIPYSSTSSDPSGDGKYCWCRVTGYNIEGEEAEDLPVSVAPWTFVGYDDDCESNCMALCGNALASEEQMRGTMYTSYGCGYAISYSAAQGCSSAFSNMPNPTSVIYGDSYTLASAPAATTGWVFNGWSCPNLSNSTLSAGASGTYSYSGNAACSAQCTCAPNYTMVNGQCVEDQPDTFSLTYDCNGGEPIDQNAQLVYTYEPNEVYSIISMSSTCQRAGYIPNPNVANVAHNWVCQADDDPDVYLTNVAGVWIYTHNYTCRAQWQLERFSLTYDVPALSGTTIENMPSPSTVHNTEGTVYQLAPLPTADGYTASGWNCTYSGNNALTPDADNQITMPSASVTCSMTWVPNTIGLHWDPNGGTPVSINTPSSCTYMSLANQSGGINNIQHPTRSGYTFNGWIVTGWDECGLQTGVDIGVSGNGRYVYINSGNETVSNWDYVLSSNQTWAVGFSYGAVAGTSVCSTENSTTLNNENPTPGSICWCSITSFTPTNGTQCNLVHTTIWQMTQDFTSPSLCESQCSQSCINEIMPDADFRKKMYGAE